MATINITRTYADGEVLLASDLDNIVDDVETFINTTKINDDNIQDTGITASSKLVDGSITTAKFVSGSVTTAKIADLAVTTPKLDDVSVTTVKLADTAVTTIKITDANVTTAKIADANVTTAKIADANVTTAKIADANVTSAKIASGAVTPTLRSAAAYAVGNSPSTITTTNTAGATITASARPVLIIVTQRTVTGGGAPTLTGSTGNELQLTRNGSVVRGIRGCSTTPIQFDTWQWIDTSAPSGSTLWGLVASTGTISVDGSNGLELSVMEL